MPAETGPAGDDARNYLHRPERSEVRSSIAYLRLSNKYLQALQEKETGSRFHLSPPRSPDSLPVAQSGNIRVNAGNGELLPSWHYNSAYILVSRISCAPSDFPEHGASEIYREHQKS